MKKQKRTEKLTPEQLCRRAAELGAKGAKVISPSQVHTAAWVRLKCQFGCGGYGQSLTCPPYSPTPEQTRTLLDGYRTAILVHVDPGVGVSAIAQKLEREAFLAGYYKAFALGAGPCDLCRNCKLDKGCAHPDQARPSMEASGIDVYATARGAGFPIEVVRTHRDKQNYYGLVLLE